MKTDGILEPVSRMDILYPISAYQAYAGCRSRDLCLRYMGENPARWADCNTTPCPCSPAFYREVLAYAKVLRDERENGKLPYSHYQLVKWTTEKDKRIPRRKVREIPITQSRLSL